MRIGEIKDKRELEVTLAYAQELYNEGKDRKAMRLLKKVMKNWEEDFPAYFHIKYRELLDEFRDYYDIQYDIEPMTDDELQRRIQKALQENQYQQKHSVFFKKQSKNILTDYLEDKISAEELGSKVKKLEKKFVNGEEYTQKFRKEIRTIFRAYFWDSITVERKIVEKYRHLIKMWFDFDTYADHWKRKAEERIYHHNDWPRPWLCVTDIADRTQEYFFIDPRLQNARETTGKEYSDEDVKLGIFQSKLQIFYEDGTYMGQHGYFRIDNWYKMAEQYPQTAELCQKRGKQYYLDWQKYVEMEKAKQKHSLFCIPAEEREKIVEIWNPYQRVWLVVVGE